MDYLRVGFNKTGVNKYQVWLIPNILKAFLCIKIFLYAFLGSLCRVIAKVQDCLLEISGFELQSSYYVIFRTNTFGKGMHPLISSAMS